MKKTLSFFLLVVMVIPTYIMALTDPLTGATEIYSKITSDFGPRKYKNKEGQEIIGFHNA